MDLDVVLALERLVAFRNDLASSRTLYDAFPLSMVNRSYFEHPNWDPLEERINRQLPIIERIAQVADPSIAVRLREASVGFPHDAQLSAVDELIGLLGAQGELESLFAPEGPKLAAKAFHPWVWNAAVDLWADGHHREALQRAATALFDESGHLPAKLGISGKPNDLVGIAFSLDPPEEGKPRLRIGGYQEGSDTWRNVHEGARYLGMACIRSIRNLSTHLLEHEEQIALEQLATLSVFARWVYEAAVKTV